jgi:Ca2+-binding EF-hand superfamily protein
MLRLLLALAAGTAPAAMPPLGPVTKPIPRAQFIAEMDAQFRRMDYDKNDQVTGQEIEQYQKLTAAAEAKVRNQAMFAQLDADKNGQLSKTEFAKLTTVAPTANAEPMLAREDGNRDQQISLIEHRSATLANFDRLDTDKDGIVTETEMKAVGIGR